MGLFGVQVKNAKGENTVILTDRLTRMRYDDEKVAAVTGSTTLSDIIGLKSVEFAYPITDTDNRSILGKAHLVSRSGVVLSWTDPTNIYTEDIRKNSLIFQFLYT